MTRDEAERLCRRLASEHPDRETHRWVTRRGPGGDWHVVKMKLPEALRRDPLKETVEAKPRPQQADDPRPFDQRDMPGTGY